MLAAALLAVALVGCARSVPRQPVGAVPPLVRPSAPVTTARWIVSRSLVAHDYVVSQHGRFVITSDSGTVDDSSSLTLDASVRRVADGGFAGLVRSIVLARQDSSPVPVPGIVLPFAFSSVPVGRGIVPAPVARAGADDPCRAASHVPLAMLRDLLLQLPDTITIGMTWADTGRYDICRDGVRLHVVSLWSFRVSAPAAGRDGASLVIARESTVSMLGERVRGDDTTRVTGAGTGTASFTVIPGNGAVQAASGTTRLSLSVQGGSRRERAEQTVLFRISLRGP